METTTKNEELTTKDVKAICSEYRLKDEDKFNLTDEEYSLREALNELDTADYIMFCLYIELASERKLANYLKMSRTPISKELKRIKGKIITNMLKKGDNGCD